MVSPFRYPKTLAVSLGLFLATAVAVSGVLRHYIKEIPPVETLQGYTPSLITKIYDIRNQLVSELFVERRTVLTLDEVPDFMRHAVLATEDRQFYEHWGVNPKAVLRAFLANVRARRTVQGGSTITQQLAKNIFLTQARTGERKIKELLLTLQMERSLTKDEILQLYFNQIYFGHGAYGVAAASRVFFGKAAGQLTLGQSALLAGIPKAPNYYSPFNQPRRAILRRNLVLNRMREEGFITEGDLLKAFGEPLGILKNPSTPAIGAYFVEHVRRELEPKYGATALYRGGLSVYTTLDLRMQKAADETAAVHLTNLDERLGEDRMNYLLKNKKISQEQFEKWKKSKEKPASSTAEEAEEGSDDDEPLPVQGAFVAIDPQTGGIRAMVGGRDFQKSKFNRAVQAKRQPGSSFKPFVWLAALESGFTAASVVDDYPLAFTDVERNPKLVAEATDYAMLREMVTGYYEVERSTDEPDPIWSPQNWDHKYLGPVTLRRGLALSRNTVSVRLMDRVGPRTVINLARRAGVVSALDPVLSLGLGVSVMPPLEIVSAISTFANNGVHMAPFSVLKVVDKEGRVLEENVPQSTNAKEPITPQSAYLVTKLMQAVVKEGTGRHAGRVGRPAAGKTGTSQEQRDVWYVGYIPGLVAGCWIGYDDFTPLGKKITSAGTTVPWWTDFMIQAAKYVPAREFDLPTGIVFAKIDADTGMLALPSCPHVTLEAFRADRVPQEFCQVDHEGLLSAEEAVAEITE